MSHQIKQTQGLTYVLYLIIVMFILLKLVNVNNLFLKG